MLQTSLKQTTCNCEHGRYLSEAKCDYRCPRCKRLLFKLTMGSNRDGDVAGVGSPYGIEIKCPKCGKVVAFNQAG